ncbi:serine hydrolase domain-containing protein [Corynebacterium freiburgense]|uniref:serine hydrolase domain-containing protein n=1 Tax=Corynebacterium freiburgense TaxID=556548 RepID=UPI0004792252|nr:serine hydrolase domain-containing protein [Corynebacterium freiburgense]WJZ02158.1 Putative penicillin-binding protein PbpX [Corynebacterium freiburgense]
MRNPIQRAFNICLALLCVLFTLTPPDAMAVTKQDYNDAIEAIGAPGIAVIEFNSDGITKETYIGKDGNGYLLGEDTPFVWGALSKSLTAAAAIQLSEEGYLDLESPITQYLPELLGSTLDAQKTTVLQLIHHTSGLPANIIPGVATNEELLQRLQNFKDIQNPGQYQYSNTGYSLLQEILSRAAGTNFADIIQEKVGKPSGSSPIISDQETFNIRVPQGHQPFFGTHRAAPVETWPNAFGSVFLSGTSKQFALYARWQLQQHIHHNSPSTIPRTRVSQNHEYGAGLNYKQRKTKNSKTIEYVYHSGSVWGYTSYIGFTPETNRGLVVFTNELGLRTQYNERRRNGANAFIAKYFELEDYTQASLIPTDILILSAQSLVLAVLAIITLYFARKPLRTTAPKSSQQAFLRTSIPLILGIASALLVYYGGPKAFGHELSEVEVGAPDIALLFHLIILEIHILTAVIVYKEIRRTYKGTGKPHMPHL